MHLKHLANFTERPFNSRTLAERINRVFLQNNKKKKKNNNNNDKVPISVAVEALDACKYLQRQQVDKVLPAEFSQYLDRNHGNKLIFKVLNSPLIDENDSKQLIKTYLVSDPKPDISEGLDVLSKANERDKTSLAYFIVRNAIYKQEILDSFNAIDYLPERRRIMGNPLTWPIVGGFIGIGLSFCDLILGAAFSSLYFITIGKYYEFVESTEEVRWAKNISFVSRVERRDELIMASRIVKAYNEFIDYNSTTMHLPLKRTDKLLVEVNKELRKRGMRMIESVDDEYYQEYWQSAGAGFEWIEPDRDPTDWLLLDDNYLKLENR